MARRTDVSLETLLGQPITVRLAGKQKKMSRRKATLLRHAIQAAEGNWASLQLLMQIADNAQKNDG